MTNYEISFVFTCYNICRCNRFISSVYQSFDFSYAGPAGKVFVFGLRVEFVGEAQTDPEAVKRGIFNYCILVLRT